MSSCPARSIDKRVAWPATSLCSPCGSFRHNLFESTKNDMLYRTNVVYSVSDISVGRISVSSQLRTSKSRSSANCAATLRGTSLYVIDDVSVALWSVAGTDVSVAYVATVLWISTNIDVSFIMCIRPYRLSIQSSNLLSGSGTSLGCGFRRDRPSGP